MAEKPKRRGPPARPEDAEIWQQVAATVKPLRRRAAPKPAAPEPAAPGPAKIVAPEKPRKTTSTGKAAARAAAAAKPPPPPPPALATPAPAGRRSIPGLDQRKAERLREGKLAIDARLDLHGMTQDAAHGALLDFLATSLRAERRCLLVITGKGSRGPGGTTTAEAKREGGVLRRAVPHWLTKAPQHDRILAVQPAAPQHGGGGALYVLLRRRRD